jgi:hypothetical protein
MRIALLLICVASIAAFAAPQKSNDSPIGAWRGESKCLVRPSACNDEEALYRFTAGSSPDALRLSANKIVDGKEQSMGADADCRVDAKAHTVHCIVAPAQLTIDLEWKADDMSGQMKRNDGTPWRKLTLHRVNSR